MNKELVGATIFTEADEEYTFIYDKYEENTPYYQINLATYEVVDAYPAALFEDIKLGFNLEIGGKITALFAK